MPFSYNKQYLLWIYDLNGGKESIVKRGGENLLLWF
jgi:hypothetical protein